MREDRNVLLRVIAKILLILGAILLGICWSYTINTYPSRPRFGSRYSFIDAFADLLNLAQMEPVGAILVEIFLLFLLFGLIFHLMGRK